MARVRNPDFSFLDFEQALSCIRPYFGPSPITLSEGISELAGHDVYIKWDNKLRTGSFKERGVINFLLSLSSSERKRGVCAASAGNHALALSYYAKKMGVKCNIIMPKNAPLVKITSSRANGAHVHLEGNTFSEALVYAYAFSRRHRNVFVHAFDDPRIIVGQGTIALEIAEQLGEFDSVIVPIGGGGLISGIGLALKNLRSNVSLIGVRSEWAVRARKNGAKSGFFPFSIADGIAVKTPGKLTEPIIEKLVDRIVVATEMDVARAIVKFLEIERALVEGAGAAGLCAILKQLIPKRFKKTVLIVSGSNIDVNMLARLINRDLAEQGRVIQMDLSVPDRPGSLARVSNIIAKNGANILEISHNRALCLIPGAVIISYILEIRDKEHKESLLLDLRDHGIEINCS